MLPVFGGEVFFEFCEVAFGSGYEVAYGGTGLAHLTEGLFGGDAAIHDPWCAALCRSGC